VQLPGAPYLVAGALVLCCALIALKTVPGRETGETSPTTEAASNVTRK